MESAPEEPGFILASLSKVKEPFRITQTYSPRYLLTWLLANRLHKG